MPFVSVRDIRIYYEIRGKGPRLLFISGTNGDLRRSPNVFDYPLACHFEILSYDQRGLGQTDRPDILYTMADYASDAEGLLEAVGWESSLVMGVSFGGMVAQEFALRYPSRVKKLVLSSASCGGASGSSYPLHELFRLPAKEKALRYIEITDTRCDQVWQSTHPEEFSALLAQRLAAFNMGAGEPGREIGARHQLEARKDHDTYDRLPALKMPVYICGGRFDGIAPAANLQAAQRQIPNAKLELFEGGHLFYLQDPRAFEHIIDFLKE